MMNSPAKSVIRFLREVLTGFAQIMLQPSPLVGVAFLFGAILNSPPLAMFGVVGCATGTLMAQACRFPDEERTRGMYGFNGGLVGLGIGYFFGTFLPLLGAVIVGGMATALIMHSMLRKGGKPFTAPFVIVTWAIMLIFAATGWAAPTQWSNGSSMSLGVADGFVRGFGQVLFQENVATGLVLFSAIAFRNWVEGLYAVLAASIGVACGYLAGFPQDAVNLGLFGYNGVLCAILFAGKSGKDFMCAMSASLLSVAIVRLTHFAGIPTLTVPFVISSWLILWGRRYVWTHRKL